MFKALLLKEFREKAPIAAFGLGLMVVFLAAFLALGDKPDLSDIIAVGFMVLVFPFIGLLLGAGAFETEFRDGAWAFLLSRPVRKETVWLAKLAAPLVYLAALWGVFLILVKSLPQLGKVVSDFSLPAGFQLEVSFVPLAIVSCLFYFSIAFSLSIVSERHISVLFGALFVGFILQGLLTSVSFILEYRGFLFSIRRSLWLTSHYTGLALMALAFLVASLRTFRKADFSQPKRKAAMLTVSALALVALSWVVAFAGPLVFSGGDRMIHSGLYFAGDKVFFSSNKGIFRYDAGLDRMRRLTRSRFSELATVPSEAGTVLYLDTARTELWTMNGDGSGKRRIVRAGFARESPLYESMLVSGLLSPDGKSVIFSAEHPRMTRTGKRLFSIWSVGSDGSGLQKLPLDPAWADKLEGSSWFMLAAWPRGGTTILLDLDVPSERGANSLWTYDPSSGAVRALFESTWFQSSQVSSNGEFAAVVYWPRPEGLSRLGLLDLKTMATTEILERPRASGLRLSWNRAGDRLAILHEPESGVLRLSVFSLETRRITESRELMRIEGEHPQAAAGWIGDRGRLCWYDPKAGALRFLAPDLSDEKAIALPGAIGKGPFFPDFGGGMILLTDEGDQSLWRLDIKTEKWKKIW